MKILLTGATGYIGRRLLPKLVEAGHFVVCVVRDVKRFTAPPSLQQYIQVVEVDLLKKGTLNNIPEDIDVAYYLVHSMTSSTNYEMLEAKSACNFRNYISKIHVRQVIYLSGIVNQDSLSRHLNSRLTVEKVLAEGSYSLTCLRAGIIIGSGSASFEIIRDLVEKLPVVVAPKWLNTKCQPIGIANVIEILVKVIGEEKTYNQSFDVGGTDILTYKEMLMIYSEVRHLKRFIYTLPVMTPRLSSYWLFFVTTTSYKLAVALVDSMKVEVVCSDTRINDLLGINPLTYRESLKRAFARIQQNEVVSSWKDAMVSGHLDIKVSDFINVPTFGCYKDARQAKVKDVQRTLDKVWSIGGETGWYHANWLWKIRGLMDMFTGGVGLRRGRTHPDHLEVGDAVDFWRVLYANKAEGRLLLFAEMKLPGEAWLEFSLKDQTMHQTATFRPIGVWGRLYWFAVYPFHGYIFNGMLRAICR